MSGPSKRLTPYLWMLISALAFAFMSELAGELNTRCHWLIVALARTSLALVYTGCLAAVQRTPLVFWRPKTLWVRSLTGSVSLLCAFFAFSRAPASEVIAITNSFPIWVAVLAWPLLGQRPGPFVWLAVLGSVAGVALMQNAKFSELNLGMLAAVVSSLLSAIVVIGLNMLHRLPSQAIVIHFSAVATVFCLAAMPFAGLKGVHFLSLDPATIGLLLVMGLTATVGQLFLTKAFAQGPASQVAVVALSQAVFCFVFEFGILDRSFPWTSIVGMILVIVPTAWMMLRRDGSKLVAASVTTAE